MLSDEKISQMLETLKFEKVSKNEVVIKKNRKFEKGVLGIILNTDLRSETKLYQANSIIEPERVEKGATIIF